MNLRLDQEVASTPGVRLLQEYAAVRAYSKQVASPLSAEDHGLQSMADASPTKWHLGHTTWFFETLVLRPFAPDYAVFNPHFHALFNSYYEALGTRHPRPQRGILSRPSLGEVWAYREHVDTAMEHFLNRAGSGDVTQASDSITLGLHHEQQHQELILTDIKHALSLNPMRPVYITANPSVLDSTPLKWVDCAGGLVEIGHAGAAFGFDNETPRHRVWLEPYQLANRAVTCGEYREFIDAGGYSRPEFWLSDGWASVQAHDWRAPLYWVAEEGGSSVFTLHGTRRFDPAEPVCHLSYYEAAAYACWTGARLPTEFEWEAAASDSIADHRHDLSYLHPRATSAGGSLQDLYGEVWEWTQSAYAPYPGFKPLTGVASEYNGKFMVNQLVLRGGSCVTPPGHLRASYRNFFPPTARWQFSGLRLARDLP